MLFLTMKQWIEFCLRSCPNFNTRTVTHTFNTFTITSSQQLAMFFIVSRRIRNGFQVASYLQMPASLHCSPSSSVWGWKTDDALTENRSLLLPPRRSKRGCSKLPSCFCVTQNLPLTRTSWIVTYSVYSKIYRSKLANIIRRILQKLFTVKVRT